MLFIRNFPAVMMITFALYTMYGAHTVITALMNSG